MRLARRSFAESRTNGSTLTNFPSTHLAPPPSSDTFSLLWRWRGQRRRRSTKRSFLLRTDRPLCHFRPLVVFTKILLRRLLFRKREKNYLEKWDPLHLQKISLKVRERREALKSEIDEKRSNYRKVIRPKK